MRILVERLLLPNAPQTTLDTFHASGPYSVWLKVTDTGALTIHSGVRGVTEMLLKAYSPGYWINAKVD